MALSQGEYPLWDPFHFWGCPEDYPILNYGQLNPFLYLALLLYKLGCPFPTAFFIYSVIYYGFAVLGFYLLAKLILQNTLLAFWAYLAMLFSSLGIGWYMQPNILLSLAPIFWFFYFFLQLINTQDKKYIWGLILMVSLILTTYVPTYFILTLIAFLLACALFCFPQLKPATGRLWEALTQNKRTVALGLLTVAIALIPRLIWYFSIQDDQYVFNVRSYTGAENTAAVGLKGANLGGLAMEYTFPELFSDLDIGTVQFYYVSIFIYLVILMSLWNTATTRLKILLFMFFFIFIYALADVTPVHKLLFYLIPTAKYARNYFFMGPLLAGLLTIFAMGHLKQLGDLRPQNARDKLRWLIYLTVIHGLALSYLVAEDFVITSSYAAVILSFSAFVALWTGRGTKAANKRFIVLITAALLVQPLEVNYHFSRRDFSPDAPQPARYDAPAFSYTRPKADEPFLRHGFQDIFEKDMRDLSGYAGSYYLGVKWSYFLNQRVKQEKFSNYTQYKFFLFDNVVYTNDPSLDINYLEKSLSEHRNLAFVSFPPAEHVLDKKAPVKAQAIEQDSPEFRVIAFRLNSIRLMTDLKEPKFLVYNDSYHTSWKATLNGQAAPLYRANFAFKGLWLPAGHNTVELRYGPAWLPWVYISVIVYFLIFSAAVVAIFIRRRRR